MKKMMISIIAAALCAASAAPVCAGADCISKEQLSSGEYIRVENARAFNSPYMHYPDVFPLDENAQLYLRSDGHELLAFQQMPDYINAVFTDNVSAQELGEALADIAPEAEVYAFSDAKYQITGINGNGKAVYNALSGSFDLKEFVYHDDPYVGQHIQINKLNSLNDYDLGYKEALEELCGTVMTDFIVTEYDIPEYGESVVRLIIKTEQPITVTEQLDIANDVYDALGISPKHYLLEAPLSGDEAIDAKSSVNGDANADSTLTLNDAVAVLQNIALPAKYPLAPQGKFNADCDGKAGISGGDALWIQMKDAGLI